MFKVLNGMLVLATFWKEMVLNTEGLFALLTAEKACVTVDYPHYWEEST